MSIRIFQYIFIINENNFKLSIKQQQTPELFEVSFKEKGITDEKAELLTNSVWVCLYFYNFFNILLIS